MLKDPDPGQYKHLKMASLNTLRSRKSQGLKMGSRVAGKELSVSEVVKKWFRIGKQEENGHLRSKNQ